MFKRKPKVLTPQEMEEIRTKDFFDCILPGTIKFLSDHYILGDNYCCVWVIREYPPSTEEQAILSQLADRSGVTLRIYHRLVEAMEQRKIIQNATRRNRLKSGGNDVKENVRKDIQTILKTAIVVDSTLDEYGSELCERLERTAEALQKTFEMEDSLMEDFRKALETAREQNSGEPEDFCYMDAEQAREMIFAMCDRLDDPKEVMQHVRTACEMLEVWEPERNRAAN